MIQKSETQSIDKLPQEEKKVDHIENLFEAIAKRDLNKVILILEENFNINTVFKDKTALEFAYAKFRELPHGKNSRAIFICILEAGGNPFLHGHFILSLYESKTHRHPDTSKSMHPFVLCLDLMKQVYNIGSQPGLSSYKYQLVCEQAPLLDMDLFCRRALRLMKEYKKAQVEGTALNEFTRKLIQFCDSDQFSRLVTESLLDNDNKPYDLPLKDQLIAWIEDQKLTIKHQPGV